MMNEGRQNYKIKPCIPYESDGKCKTNTPPI